MKINQIILNNNSNRHAGLNENRRLSFGKKLLGKTNVRRTWGETERVKVFEYDPKNKKDRKQISDLNHKHWGKAAKYMYSIAFNFSLMTKEKGPEKTVAQRFYGIEDRYSHALAIAEVQSSDAEVQIGNFRFPNCTKIALIQTKPTEMYSSDERTYEGLGETLVKEIVKQAKEDDRDAVILYSTNHNFWNNSGFFRFVPEIRKKGYDIMKLEKKDFDNYIKFVENKANFENPYLDIYV